MQFLYHVNKSKNISKNVSKTFVWIFTAPVLLNFMKSVVAIIYYNLYTLTNISK